MNRGIYSIPFNVVTVVLLGALLVIAGGLFYKMREAGRKVFVPQYKSRLYDACKIFGVDLETGVVTEGKDAITPEDIPEIEKGLLGLPCIHEIKVQGTAIKECLQKAYLDERTIARHEECYIKLKNFCRILNTAKKICQEKNNCGASSLWDCVFGRIINDRCELPWFRDNCRYTLPMEKAVDERLIGGVIESITECEGMCG